MQYRAGISYTQACSDDLRSSVLEFRPGSLSFGMNEALTRAQGGSRAPKGWSAGPRLGSFPGKETHAFAVSLEQSSPTTSPRACSNDMC